MSAVVERILSYILGAIAGITIGFISVSLHGAPGSQNLSSSILGFWMLPENIDFFVTVLTGCTLLGLLATFGLRTHQKVEVLRAEANSYNEAVTILSHQLRTTLTVANWGIEITLKNYDQHLTETDKEMLNSVSKEIQTIVMQSVNLLDIATVESGKMTLALVSTTLGALQTIAHETMTKFKSTAEKKKVVLNETIKLDPEVKLLADPLRIRFIIENLTENALNYTPEGNTVDVSITNDTNYLHIVVKDTGIGIPMPEWPKIFGRFYRATNARNLISTGTGVGLYLSKEYVGLHHGTIRFETRENMGTTFYVSIPIKDTAHPEEFFEKI